MSRHGTWKQSDEGKDRSLQQRGITLVGAYDAQMESLLADYRTALAEAGEVHRRITEIVGAACSPRQTVRVTVTAQGELLSVEFPTDAYKRMPPAELSEAIAAAVRAAKEDAFEQLAAVVPEHSPGGLPLMDLIRGRVKPADLFGAQPAVPDAVREYLGGSHLSMGV